jgi:DNA modification methylase
MNVLDQAFGRGWAFYNGDSTEVLREIPASSVHLSVYSPPFCSLYTYSPTERDLGNSTDAQFWPHYRFIIRELLRVTLPGRNTCVHVSDIPAMLVRDGYIGLKDFPGEVIRAHEEEGWVYHGRVCIQKNPQSQAIRTHSKSLLFNQLHKDASWSRPALADYILVFRKPGENPIPILSDLTNEDWISWAQPLWLGISETDTLQYHQARDDEDERHIAPLQLGTIERCVRLWSNPGEIVLSPFGGIGSEGYVAIKQGRQAVLCELKTSYWRVGVRNVQMAEADAHRPSLFDAIGAAS